MFVQPRHGCKLSPCTMSVQYTCGCAVHLGTFSTPGEIMSTLGGYHEYTWGCSVRPEGYHDKCGGGSLGKQLNWFGNPGVLMISPILIMVSLRCTEHLPVYSGYPPVYPAKSPSVLHRHYARWLSYWAHELPNSKVHSPKKSKEKLHENKAFPDMLSLR